VSLSIQERRTLGARAGQLAKRIMRRTGLDEASAVVAAKLQVGFDKPDFTVTTPDAGHWEGRYWVPDLPTRSMTPGGMAFAPTKHAARVRSHLS
jgi:hypothetical protein